MLRFRTAGGSRILLVILTAAIAARACPAAEPRLRVGGVYTPEQARERLARMAEQIPDGDAWRRRAADIRAGILRGAKLERLPAACDLRPIRHSRREYDGYSVENVAFEALPGFFVTGNLYLPLEFKPPIPGVLAPHGHGAHQRFHESTQIRCATLARMGVAVLAWDMLGYGESQPCGHDAAEALRIQTYSSLRAVDFLLSLGVVDERRLAVSGESGGGTQSFLLAAIDPRIDVSAPVVQVSAHFYGGCGCESRMPIHVHDGWETNNVEIAASFAPKPLLLVSCGADWTRDTPEVEFPYVRRIYRLLGAEAAVENAHFASEGHDYGPSKRAAVSRFFAKHLGLDVGRVTGPDGGIDESFVTLLDRPALSVFDAAHPRPAHALTTCDEVRALLDNSAR